MNRKSQIPVSVDKGIEIHQLIRVAAVVKEIVFRSVVVVAVISSVASSVVVAVVSVLVTKTVV